MMLEAADLILSLSSRVEALEGALKDLMAWKAVIRQNLMRLDPNYDHTKFDAEWDEKISAATSRALSTPKPEGVKP